MLIVYLLPQGGFKLSFQRPWSVAGWPPWPRGTDEQIAAVLEIQGGQLRVVAGGKALDPLVGGKFGRVARAQVEGHAAEKPLVLGHVGLADVVERFLRGRVQAAQDQTPAGSPLVSLYFL